MKVTSFKVPTPSEFDHDFLWRVHRHPPARGKIAIFNRSHDEEETTLLKFFLHIDLEEQKARLQERLQDPRKRWKFGPADVEERQLWGQGT